MFQFRYRLSNQGVVILLGLLGLALAALAHKNFEAAFLVAAVIVAIFFVWPFVVASVREAAERLIIPEGLLFSGKAIGVVVAGVTPNLIEARLVDAFRALGAEVRFLKSPGADPGVYFAVKPTIEAAVADDEPGELALVEFEILDGAGRALSRDADFVEVDGMGFIVPGAAERTAKSIAGRIEPRTPHGVFTVTILPHPDYPGVSPLAAV